MQQVASINPLLSDELETVVCTGKDYRKGNQYHTVNSYYMEGTMVDGWHDP